MSAAETAWDDQERAALAEAEGQVPEWLAQPGSCELDEVPAGIAVAVQAGQMAVLLGLVPAEHCQHNADSGPGLAATATWAANAQVCRRCEDRLRPPPEATHLCDLCGATKPVEAIGRLLVGPLLVRYRLCWACVTARDARQA